ncbi:hypothetical protein CRG98_046615 [Punica granatum]|uniref:Uncharacterized protein n=1 Tax=Punica granatum TaxID=22663 RepID=A0A2I0HNG3_PUNGR|nr:hypothetical protein CRG98_046615 [Punica granatum]
MKALLVQHNLKGALEGEHKKSTTLSPDEKIVMDLTNVNIKISNEDQAVLLLSTLSESYERFIVTMLHGSTSITLEDVNAELNLKEIRELFGAYWSIEGGKILMTDVVEAVRVRIEMCDGSESILEEKYLDVLRHGRVNQCKDYIMVAKSSKSFMRRYVVFDKAALTKLCKSVSWVKVEPCSKTTSPKNVEFEDSRTLIPQHVVIEDIQTERSDKRQHSLWSSSGIRDK